MSMDSTERFSRRAPYYHPSRPRYPRAMLDLLAAEIGLTPDRIIADIGAGTGISSELFLDYGCTVYALEPNPAMRAVAQTEYGTRPNFHLSDGTAEATGLSDRSVDVVIAGQAFHWFKHAAARAEFDRICKSGGHICLFWNTRRNPVSEGDGFLKAYNALVGRYDLDGSERLVQTTSTGEGQQLADFFGVMGFHTREISNQQMLGWEQFMARLMSASYLPLPGDTTYEPMIADARALFTKHQADGRVMLPYVTEVYWNR